MINKLLRWFSHTNFWVWLNKNFISKFTFRWNSYPEFPMVKYFDMLKAIEEDTKKNGPGIYAFVSTDVKSLSAKIIRFFSKAYWSHAGILFDSQNIIQMKSTGCYYWHILELMKEIDYLAVGRIELIDGAVPIVQERMDNILEEIAKFSYDFQIELNNGGRKYYCSELVYQLTNDLTPSSSKIRPKVEYGRLVFEPDDLYNAMKIVFEYKR